MKNIKKFIVWWCVITGEERTWESARAAAEEVAGDPKYSNNILNAADKGWRAYGYRWRRMGRKRNKKEYMAYIR
jgi:hypothetical protein